MEAAPDTGASGDVDDASPSPGGARTDEREAPDPDGVERRYDFEDFGPERTREMSPTDWEAAFDPDAWITGDRLLDRALDELRARVAM
ncbi:hypothetical protein BRD13_04140 [Halobacteriales archaeon SW_5_70_135]|nr:MAG: hypothetical protein BRD13_04140 [Halobacteriales archaeon SW_5_70_135]